MTSGKTINHKAVESEFLRLCPWAENNYTTEDIIKSINNVIQLAASGNIYTPRTDIVVIEEGRGKLPSNFQFIDSVASTNAKDLKEAEELMCSGKLVLKWVNLNNDSFNRTWHKTVNEFKSQSGIRFRINQNYIFPNFENGVLAIAYMSLPVDADGYPELPSGTSWLNAAVYDCGLMVANRMFMIDKLTNDKRILMEGYRNHYISQAGTKSRMPTKAESVQHKNNQISEPDNFNPEHDFFSTFGNTYGINFRQSN